jgi:transcriptional repressor NrdR
VDSRSSGEREVIRRRRECQSCLRRYTTYERYERAPRWVIKKDKRREPFSREKVMAGLLKACEKRSVSFSRLEEVVDLVERRVNEDFDYEVASRFVGETLVQELKQIDQVAYVRFASVYQEFADVTEFLRELTPLLKDSHRSSVEVFLSGNGSPQESKAGDGEDSGQDSR